jgi:hypothetical protein
VGTCTDGCSTANSTTPTSWHNIAHARTARHARAADGRASVGRIASSTSSAFGTSHMRTRSTSQLRASRRNHWSARSGSSQHGSSPIRSARSGSSQHGSARSGSSPIRSARSGPPHGTRCRLKNQRRTNGPRSVRHSSNPRSMRPSKRPGGHRRRPGSSSLSSSSSASENVADDANGMKDCGANGSLKGVDYCRMASVGPHGSRSRSSVCRR